MEAALQRAIEIAGNMTALAGQLGISPQAVAQWSIAPISRVLKIEEVTGVKRYQLRPDIYPPPVKRKPVKIAKKRARA